MSELPTTTPTTNTPVILAGSDSTAFVSSAVAKPGSPSVICDLPGELVMIRDMPIVSMAVLNNSLLLRIVHSVKHIFNPNQQDIHLQPGRHDKFSQELFRCEFAYLPDILVRDDPERCDIIIRLVHSSARRVRIDHTTRLLQTITVMLGNEIGQYLDQCQEKAKRNKKAPNYYRPYVRKDKKRNTEGGQTSKTPTPPQKPN